MNTIAVDNLDETLEKIVAGGGENVHPKMTIPDVGHLAYCKDTEGNTFGMMERLAAAE